MKTLFLKSCPLFLISFISLQSFALDAETVLTQQNHRVLSGRVHEILKYRLSNLNSCDQKTQELLHQLYSKINPAVIAYANVTKLINEIAPIAGFDSGAIYLINPSIYSLEPRLVLGKPKEELAAIFYREQEYRQNLVTVAFTGKLPVVESYQDNHLLGIAGILGDLQRVGVLYLVPKSPVENNRQPSLRAHFKALQQTLNDCLNLN